MQISVKETVSQDFFTNSFSTIESLLSAVKVTLDSHKISLKTPTPGSFGKDNFAFFTFLEYLERH